MYNKIFSTKVRRIIYLIIINLVVFSTATYMIMVHRSIISGEFEVSALKSTFSYAQLLIMFTAGLWGIAPAMVAFVLSFIDAIIYDVNEAYAVSVYLIALAFAYILSNRKFFRHIWSTILGGLIMTGVMGGAWSMIGTIASGDGLVGIHWSDVLSDQGVVAVECALYCIAMYIFMHCAPAKIKRAFPMGVDYIEGDELTGDIRDYRFIHNSRISRKLSKIVIIQVLLLGICASAFAAGLMPAIADEVLSDSASDTENFFRFDKKPTESVSSDSEAPEPPKEDGETLTQRRENRLARQRFVFNNAGASFVMKLILMILNVALPLVVLENSAVQALVARPITAMAKTLQDFSNASPEDQGEKLKIIESVHLRGKDEIADLYQSISDMAHTINSFVDQKLREAELEEEIRVAQRACESQNNFLNNVSHELRTPINAVLGLDEMIIRESSEENIKTYANDIASAGKSLLSLVNDILDSSKLEEGRMEIIPVEYELGSVINDIINMISVKASDKSLRFDIDVDEHLPHILYGDEIRIKQVIVNILNNAVKYTEKGGFTLTLGFEKVSDEDIMLKCSVADTGIGIKEEDMDKLFKRFERIEEKRNRTIEGTGLGMNIVQQLLGLMDSSLSVESVYGKGSTFSFELKQRVVSWEEIGDFAESYRRSLMSETGYRKRFTAADAEILVTDDTPMNLTVICGLLKSTEIKIDTAESGFETLDLIKKKKYDVIFLDHRMPEMDGIETLAKMKELTDNPNADTPVISLTANAISGAREVYLGAGFADYLSKPIDSAKLEKMLMNYLPDEKVVLVEDDSVADSPEISNDEPAPVDPLLLEFSKIPGIDYLSALKNCSNEEILLSAVRDYYNDIVKKTDLIESYADSEDYENYTVLVHALKSSSRLIGAMSLSEEAKRLEAFGNQAKDGNENAISEIKKRTPVMLEIYRGYHDGLAPIFGDASDYDASDEPDERELISQEKLNEGLMCLRDLADAFDYDSMDSVIAMLDEYRMPEDFIPHYENIKEQIHNIDYAALTEELDQCLS